MQRHLHLSHKGVRGFWRRHDSFLSSGNITHLFKCYSSARKIIWYRFFMLHEDILISSSEVISQIVWHILPNRILHGRFHKICRTKFLIGIRRFRRRRDSSKIRIPNDALVKLSIAWIFRWSTRSTVALITVNTLRPRQTYRHFADSILKCIFLNENVIILLKVSLKFNPKVPISNIPALDQKMAWHRPGDKPLSESMMVMLLTHICVTRS